MIDCRYGSGKRIDSLKPRSLSGRPRREESGRRGGFRGLGNEGQVWIEAIVWILVLMLGALGYVKLSQLEYRAYRNVLKKHDSRADSGSFPARSY